MVLTVRGGLHSLIPVALCARAITTNNHHNHHLPKTKVPALVLLDRDGVINTDVGYPGVLTCSQLELTPNAGHAIGRLKRVGCSVVMVTNQSSVGKGLLSHNVLETIQQKVQERLWEQDPLATFDRIYQCTSADPNHPRRKPNPGMVKEALRDFPSAPRTYFVGDTSTDLQAAAAGGVEHRILVSTGYGHQLMNRGSTVDDAPNEPLWIQNSDVVDCYHDMHPSTAPFLYCRNLAQATEFIIDDLNDRNVDL
jgi:D-glycero-D-manno-heptose 1,7-bisphosphate phosphatase